MFIRTEDFRTFLRLYPVISVIVATHFILWIYVNFLPGGETIFSFGVGFNYGIAEGEYWRLVTAILLHGGFGHVLFNSFSLVLFGPYLEILLGKVKFIITYLLAGIIANIATFFLEPLQYFHLGASGAIFGLFGIYVYMILYRQELIDRANRQVVMVILILGLFMTFTSGNINIIGHIFGLLGGTALAPIVLRRI